jgi:ABC-type uncharacterized transport system substrate-binding protein
MSLRRLAFALAALVALAAPAAAHPHVFIQARAELVMNAEGQLVAVRHRWTFDEVFSAFAKQGLDRNGRYTRESLAPLAEVNVTSLSEFGYFTQVRAEGSEGAIGAPENYWLDHDDATGLLTLNFTLPLRQPISAKARPVLVQIADPEYFVAFEMVETDPVALAGAPRGCTFELRRPRELDESQAAELAQIPPTMRNLPPALQALTDGLSNDVSVRCP